MKFSFYDTEKLISKDVIVSPETYDSFIHVIRNNDFAFCGYGNSSYEDIIVNELISNPQLFTSMSTRMFDEHFIQRTQELNSELTEVLLGFKRMNLFHHFDLSILLFSAKNRSSLDDLRYTLPFDDIHIPDLDIIKYVFDHNISEINARLQIENRFAIDLINRPTVDIGLDICRKLYCQRNNLKWNDLLGLKTECAKIKLSDCVQNLPIQLNIFTSLQDFINKEVFIPGYNNIETNFIFQDMKCKFSLGGIKAFRDKDFYTSQNNQLVYIDAKSFYPSLFVNYQLHPQHLNTVIVDIIREMMFYRFECKDNCVAAQIKVAMNALIGKMMVDGWMYDPWKHTQLVMCGNIIILNLLSELDNFGCTILQCNNDGMFLSMKKGELHKLKIEVDKFNIKYHTYFQIIELDKLLLYTPTSYIYSTQDNQYVRSGLFDTLSLNYGKTNIASVIPNSVFEYFFDNVNPCEYIKSNVPWIPIPQIYDFLEFVTSANGQKIHASTLIDKCRYYYSTSGINIFNAKIDFNNIKLSSKINNNQTGVQLVTKIKNDYSDIDYQYYIKEAQKIINEITQKQLTLF